MLYYDYIIEQNFFQIKKALFGHNFHKKERGSGCMDNIRKVYPMSRTLLKTLTPVYGKSEIGFQHCG